MKDFLAGTVTPRDWFFTIGIFGTAAVIGAVFYVFAHQPQMERLADIKAKDAILVKDLEQARKIAQSIEDLRERMKKIEQLVSVFEERLPSQHELASLLVEFENMASDQGLDVELTSLTPSRDGRKETIPYRIIARGPFHQIMTFVNQLERYKRYLKITDLMIEPVKDSYTDSQAEFTLNTYRFIKPEKKADNAASAA